MDFAVLADHRVKLKEGEKRDKKKTNKLALARELKKLWNRKVSVIPIVVGALGTVPKELVKELEDLKIRGQVERPFLTTSLLRLAGILRKVTQILVKNNRLTLMRKNLKRV